MAPQGTHRVTCKAAQVVAQVVGWHRRRLITGLVVAGALALSACSSVTPAFPGTPPVPPYSQGECKTVLVVGDSMAEQIGNVLQSRLALSGRCSHVVNDGIAGTSVTDWVGRTPSDLDATAPDLVVVHFIGNEGWAGPPWTDPSWLNRTTSAALTIVDAALARGIPVYWAIPPKAAWTCTWGSLNDQRWTAWETWVRSQLPGLRPITLIDLRTPFGGETYNGSFKFADGTTKAVRQPDCVHFSDAGAVIAADVVVFTIQGEWRPATPPSTGETTTTTEPTTTSTTEPSTTTSTTAAASSTP